MPFTMHFTRGVIVPVLLTLQQPCCCGYWLARIGVDSMKAVHAWVVPGLLVVCVVLSPVTIICWH